MKLKKNLLAIFSIVALTLSPLVGVASYNSSAAQTYLLAHSNNPWATMGLAALNTSGIPTDYLKNISASFAIDYEAPILAITAVNQNPAVFGLTDYVAALENFHAQNQLGDPTALNDDIFGILALISAGISPADAVISDSKNFLLAHQLTGGGWGYSTSAGADSNTTASAIVALIASGVPPADSHIQNALNYLKTAQNSDSGFTYDPASQYGTDSDSSSTAWAMWALASAGIDQSAWSRDGHTPADYLSANQDLSGYFKYQSGSGEDSFSPAATGYAVIALAGKTLPLRTIVSASSQQFPFRIEGSGNTVCAGQTAGPTALDIVKNAAILCGFSYDIKDTSYGPYLDQINNDAASGNTGWLYLVNYISPGAGAGDYQLKTGDTVLWYFGQAGWQPTKTDLSAAEVGSGQTATVTVQYFNNNTWQALGGAAVLVGTNTFTTTSDGTASVTAPDGYYKIYAQKSGYIRSNSQTLKIGNPISTTVNLSVNIASGQVQGTTTPSTIAFTVDQSSLDFGNLAAGQSSSKNLKITNTGSGNISVGSTVNGDSVFVDNLSLNNIAWSSFQTALNAGGGQTIGVKLQIPQNYSVSSGTKNGSMIFWAQAQ